MQVKAKCVNYVQKDTQSGHLLRVESHWSESLCSVSPAEGAGTGAGAEMPRWGALHNTSPPTQAAAGFVQ